LRELYIFLVDLRERVLNSTGKDLGPVEKIDLFDSTAVSTLVTPAHLEPNNKDRDEGPKKPPMNEKELRHLEALYLMKKKKFYSVKTEFLKKQVRISKSLLIFHIMLSLYEVHEMTTLWVVKSVHIPSACFISGSIEIIFMKLGI
jgi:hypothetical protein